MLCRIVKEQEQTYDTLTGIPNFSSFMQEAAKLICYNEDTRYAIIVFDVDKFKLINDQYNMHIGDMVLIHIADVLKERVTRGNSYARLHSNVCAVCMEYERKGDIIKFIEKLRKGIARNEVMGAEVLARWNHPRKGLIQPNNFIPKFEKNGFILQLDAYMWEEDCRTIRTWIDEGRKPIPLSVNISRYHIYNARIEEILKNLLAKYQLKPEHLSLEITETLFFENTAQLYSLLNRLQALGFKLEVDDFGSGYSSLNMLRKVPVDTIKIDKDFLDETLTSEKGKIVIRHTIDMAKELQLLIVAEGVETEEHVEFLKKSHCDIAQGYFFARPMPIEAFNKLAF